MLGNTIRMELPKEPIVSVHTTENRGIAPKKSQRGVWIKLFRLAITHPPQ